jgi:hypothetical protein
LFGHESAPPQNRDPRASLSHRGQTSLHGRLILVQFYPVHHGAASSLPESNDELTNTKIRRGLRRGLTSHCGVAVQLRMSYHFCESGFQKSALDQRTLNPRGMNSISLSRTIPISGYSYFKGNFSVT